MKEAQNLDTQTAEILIRGLRESGIEPDHELISKFTIYLQELMKWNRVYNITALKKEKEIVQKHFLDSLLYLSFLKDIHSVADVGSGGGFPGLVLKIARPELSMHLIEPSRKKAAFLKHMIFRLKLDDIQVHQQRVEALSIKVEAAVSRALFKIKDFLKRASHILYQGGIIILNKGPEVQKELENLKGLKQFPTLSIQVFEKILPTTEIKRYLVVVKL
ncbi:MAG: 16S rRNA (guanine(527)-N(7))-methyltransferase RsmG [Thermodesulfovibrionales bacterium]|nr:16S rRNA (guanine(527)-N(7))-methyltransferase RsmG [Thermodesulfovibrionales bacterium]